MTTNEFNPSPPPWLRAPTELESDRLADQQVSAEAGAPPVVAGGGPEHPNLPPLPRRIRSIPLEVAYPEESEPGTPSFDPAESPVGRYPAAAEYDPTAGEPDQPAHGYDALPRADYPAPGEPSPHPEAGAGFSATHESGAGLSATHESGAGFDAPSGPGFDTPPQLPPAQQGPVYSWAPPPTADHAQHRARSLDDLPPMSAPAYRLQPQPTPPAWPTAPSPPPAGTAPKPVGADPGGSTPPGGGSVNELSLLKRAKRPPRSGWRRAIHKISGGAINPGESAADVAYRELVDRVNQPVRGDYRIAILSLKGGVGKTTTTIGLGSTFASLRGDRVIAVDANPDLGTLAHRIPRQTRSTVRNLLEDPSIHRYSDVRAHTSQAPSRLEILASEQDPAVSEAFSAADYRRTVAVLQQFYNIILTDCGTGLMHSAMSGVLTMASSLVLVTSPAIDGARSASATLDWLDHHGYRSLVKRTVVVVNSSRRGASTVDLDQLRRLFLDRTRAVQVIPFDDHLAEGAEIDLELVGKATRKALLELAAMVADDFSAPIKPADTPH